MHVEASYIRQARSRVVLLAYLHTRFPNGQTPALVGTLRGWVDTWAGLGGVVSVMIDCGYDLQLTRYGGQGWRATFFPGGAAHSLTASVGGVFAGTPWRAVQGAALDALLKAGSL